MTFRETHCISLSVAGIPSQAKRRSKAVVTRECVRMWRYGMSALVTYIFYAPVQSTSNVDRDDFFRHYQYVWNGSKVILNIWFWQTVCLKSIFLYFSILIDGYVDFRNYICVFLFYIHTRCDQKVWRKKFYIRRILIWNWCIVWFMRKNYLDMSHKI